MTHIARRVHRKLASVVRSAPATMALFELVSFDDALRRAHICYERKQASVVEQLVPTALFDRASDCTNMGARRVTGQIRFDKLRKTLAAIGIEFSQDQQEFINCMIGALAKLLCKEDLAEMIEDLLADLRTTRLFQEVMAMMGRRDGKTWSVSAMVVAILCAIENIEIGIFATGRRASQKLLELVLWFIDKIGTCRIKKCNAETIWIQGDCGPTDVRKVSAYPSNVRISAQFLVLSFLFFCCSMFFFLGVGRDGRLVGLGVLSVPYGRFGKSK
jgi:Probable DNA packing protein, N-terminus